MKNNKLLTFELDESNKRIEIHGNSEGFQELINYLQKAVKSKDHIHLMTPEWGGDSLTEEKQGNENELINHVKVFCWDD